jgi:EamA-like transporter family
LHFAGWKRWLGVLGGAVGMFGGAALLAMASSHQAAPGKANLGIVAALGAGILWGTMYIPYRKAYLTGMNPLSFITFFTFGELVTMLTLAVGYRGAAPLRHDLVNARPVLFWLMLGGFVWVIGDLFQQYATKYVGISRGIPLSNTNQLWGLLWGVFVFHELEGAGRLAYAEVAGGSLMMTLGAVAISLSSATAREHFSWRSVADRESRRYGVKQEYVRAGMEGRELAGEARPGRTDRSLLDWMLIITTTAIFALLGSMAHLPHLAIAVSWAVMLTLAMCILLAGCAVALWRTTHFR